MIIKVYKTKSAAETQEAGRDFAKSLIAGDVVALYGGLGAGKTTFVRGIAQQLCPDEQVTSPTFTIAHEYEGAIPVFHFDMYRISTFEDLYNIGFFEYLDRCGICIIEWSENIENELPEGHIKVTFEGEGEDRTITVERSL